MKQFYLLFFLPFILLQSCRTPAYNKTADYDRLAPRHQLVAVLPYDINTSGRGIDELSEEELYKLKLSESEYFQNSLYSEILLGTGRRSYDIKISVQDVNRTNRLLNEAGIDLTRTSEYSPNELGQILGVDAIVITKLFKDNFLKREEAFAVDVVGREILNRIPTTRNMSVNRFARTSKVDIICSIVDTHNEVAIWMLHDECNLDWRQHPDEVVEQINGRITERFAYR